MIYVKKLNEEAIVPTKGHEDDGGWDIYTPKNFEVGHGQITKVGVGIVFLLPKGWTGLVRARSSLFQHGIYTHGTIDRYTGEIFISMTKLTYGKFAFEKGQRIAQIVTVKTVGGACDKIKVVEKVPDTSRGSGGHGSTGK